MQAIGGHPGAVEPPRRFPGEQDVAQLRTTVGGETIVPLLAHQIVEFDRGTAMGVRCHIDDAGGGRSDKARAQQGGEQKIRQMVERKGALQPFGGCLPPPKHRTRIVDQHVDARQRGELLAERAHMIHPGEIRIVHVDARLRRVLLEQSKRCGSSRRVSAHEHEVSPHDGEPQRGLQTNSRGRAGDDADLAVHGCHVCH